MKHYLAKDMFLTLQGEGVQAGRRAVFVRFAGCNLWSGLETDRRSSCSVWCDTDFRGTDGQNGGRYSASGLACRVAELWGSERPRRYVVLTGGEPTLQVDHVLIDALHRFGFQVAIETNGTRTVPESIDWITVSPKAGHEVVQRRGQELKLVWPQTGIAPSGFLGWSFERFILQPKAGDPSAAAAAVRYCLDHPEWVLGLQTHKMVGLP